MDYDVIILGGGLAGCATACALSQYNLNIAVIERNFDIAEEVAPFITSFISDGTDIPDERLFLDLKESKTELLRIAEALNLDFRVEPSLSVYESDASFQAVKERIARRGIQGYGSSAREAQKLSPHIKDDARNILHHQETGIISPMILPPPWEIAFDNGVRFRLEEGQSH